MHSAGNVKRMGLESHGLGPDKAAKLGLAPRIGSCSQQQNYASLAMGNPASGEKDVKVDIEEAVRAVDMALMGLDLTTKRPASQASSQKIPVSQPTDLARRSLDRRSMHQPQKLAPRSHVQASTPQHPAKKWEEQCLGKEALAAMAQTANMPSRQEPTHLRGTRGSRYGSKPRDSLSSLGSGSQFGGLFTPPGFGSDGPKRSIQHQPDVIQSTWTASPSCFTTSSSSGLNLQYVKDILAHQQTGAPHIVAKGGYTHIRGTSSNYGSLFSQPSSDILSTGGSQRSMPERSSTFLKKHPPSSVSKGYYGAGTALDSAMNLHFPDILGHSGAPSKHMNPGWRGGPAPKAAAQNDAQMKSEQALLLAIAGILKCALEGNMGTKDMKSDLNFLIVTVRKHLQDYQQITSEGAEMLKAIISTLPTVCKAARFTDDVISSLRRLFEVIIPGHYELKSQLVVLNGMHPRAHPQLKQLSEVQHLLTRIHRKLTGGSTSNGVQHVALALFESSGDISCSLDSARECSMRSF